MYEGVDCIHLAKVTDRCRVFVCTVSNYGLKEIEEITWLAGGPLISQEKFWGVNNSENVYTSYMELN
jgi:hypothetical protein